MTRISEIIENEKFKTSTNRIDKDSSARIIKRSLWMHANKKSKQQTDDEDKKEEEEEVGEDDTSEATIKKVKLADNSF
jgi:hypothetical protein